MSNIKMRLIFLVNAVVICGFAAANLWLPSGTAYQAPDGGTLVIDEQYGSDFDGVGSWVVGDGSATISQTSDSILVETNGGRAQINLPFQLEGSAGVDYVIDVGLKSWSTNNYTSTWWHAIWWIQSAAANGMQQRWVTDSGNLKGMVSGEAIPYAIDTGYVLRFTSSLADYTATLVSNIGDDGSATENYKWSSPDENFFALWGTSSAVNTSEIAWVKVYTGVSTTEAPLEAQNISVPWTPQDAVYLPPIGGTMVLAEDYGADFDGAGSWVVPDGENATINADPNDSIIITNNGGRAQIYLPFQPEGSAGSEYVIDVGLKGWSTENYTSTWWHSLWWIHSAAANGIRNAWYSHSGNLRGMNSAQALPYSRDTGYVLRFSSKVGEDPVLVHNYGIDGTSQESYNAVNPAENFFAVYGTSSAVNTHEIAWVRVYSGVSTTEAPLEIPVIEQDVPWTPAGTVYSPPIGGLPVLSENYGSQADGVGSWVCNDSSWIVEIPDAIAVFTNGGWVQLDLPFQPHASAGTNYVIDVGLKGWSASPYSGGWWHNIWWIQSAAANGMMHRWMTNYGNLRADTSQQTIPYSLNTGYVLRFSTQQGDLYKSNLITNLGQDGVCQEDYRWATPSENFFALRGTVSSENLNVISWIRIYKDVATDLPPLVESSVGTVLRSDISGLDGEPDGYVDEYDLNELINNWLQSGAL